MIFDYKKRQVTVEAYGEVFQIPTKTATLVDKVNHVSKKIDEAPNALENVKAVREGIAVFIGEEATEKIFPADKIAEADTDEIAAFWWSLNNASNKATREVIEKYHPNHRIPGSK